MSIKPNRLANEKSPYLLQHSNNPVEWYPWGEEAFNTARSRDVPVFLSIGYSTCHWCHVMAHESFEDAETAHLLNQAFVCVKVDREERPDIDATYMRICQLLTGGGGWPLTILMTSEKEPFFAGTYLPKKRRGGMLGLDELTKRVSELWLKDRYRLVSDAASNLEALASYTSVGNSNSLDAGVLESAYLQLSESFDDRNGGFGQAPKFPSPHNLMFLLRYWHRTRETNALNMVAITLKKMASGGIRDHLGGGFHRYSTDAGWTIPHFEKMLYDQATLTLAYVETFQATGDPLYADIAREVADYVLNRLTSDEGGFYSAEDADSEGEEGRFYVWRTDEFTSILDEKEQQVAVQTFNVSTVGNFSDKPGTNVLTSLESPDSVTEKLNITRTEYYDVLSSARSKLYSAREKRPRPLLDDKILVDWNGLMIAAFARIGSVLGEKRYVDAATKAATFIKEKMCEDTVYHRYRLGEKSIPGFLDDYACFAWGLTELFEATFEVKYLLWAKELVDDTNQLFWDENQGGYNLSRHSEDSLPIVKEFYDGAKPSGNSVMAMNLVRLGKIFGSEYDETSEKLFKVVSNEAKSNPVAFTYLLNSYAYSLGPSHEVVIVGDDEKMEKTVREIRRHFLPNTILMVRDGNLEKLLDYTRNMSDLNGSPAIYICRNRSCSLPIADLSTALTELEASVEQS
jgi:uncharacterized protein